MSLLYLKSAFHDEWENLVEQRTGAKDTSLFHMILRYFISSSDSFSMAWGSGTAMSASTNAALWLLPFGFQVPSPGVDMGLR